MHAIIQQLTSMFDLFQNTGLTLYFFKMKIQNRREEDDKTCNGWRLIPISSGLNLYFATYNIQKRGKHVNKTLSLK